MKTHEQLLDENNRLRAAVRSVTPNAVIRELAEKIRVQAAWSPVPDYRAGMMAAANMLDFGAPNGDPE